MKNQIKISISLVLINSLYSMSFGQTLEYKQNYFTIDVSAAAINLRVDNRPLGKEFGLGIRAGVTQNFHFSNKLEGFVKLNYSQNGTSYIRVFPTGIIDTTNIYNTIQVYRQQIRLNYINAKIGIRKNIYQFGPIIIYGGINFFSGILLNARIKGEELQGSGRFNNSATGAYKRLNLGVEPELRVRVNMADNNFFFITAAYEIGVPNVLLNTQISTERTRAYTIGLNIPVIYK